MRVTALSLFCVYISLSAGASAQAISDVTGTWRTVRHGALVLITDCGDGTPCGALAEVSAAVTDGHSTDIRNPDPTKRDRPLVGVPILWGFTPSDTGWGGGRLYNPDDGKTFRSYLQLLSPSDLRVTGCLGPFCRSQVWTLISKE